jgi:hypothetical protein
MTVYSYAPEAETIGRQLIAAHHPDLLNYGNVRIEYLFRDKASKSHGRTVWGKTRKLVGMNAFLTIPRDDAPESVLDTVDPDPLFVIELAYDVWTELSPKQQVALIDHELSHCHITLNDDGEMILELHGHDVEEFETILQRHGTYKPDLKRFAKIAHDVIESEQLSLLDADPHTGEIR